MEPTTGPANVCRGAVIALQNGTALPGNFSKQWLSSNSKATVNNNGNVTGISPGAVRITYKLNYSNPDFGTCSSAAIRDLAVLAIPATPAISFIVRPTYEAGTTSICLFSTFVLRGSLAGGTWSSAGAVTVNSNGLVTASSIGTGTVTYTVYNTSGCSYSRTVTYNVVSCETYAKSANTSAINKDAAPVLLTSSYKFILYPNPARTRVFFNVALEAGEGNAVLSDMQGKELKIIVFKPGINSIEISNYPAGMYFVTFRTKQGFQTEKLVID